MITIKTNNKFNKTKFFFDRMLDIGKLKNLDKYGEMGVKALEQNTPKDTGMTSKSWDYRIEDTVYGKRIVWFNTNYNKGYSVALLIQYGHASRNGTYVKGIDYINPALRPVFNEISDQIKREMKR